LLLLLLLVVLLPLLPLPLFEGRRQPVVRGRSACCCTTLVWLGCCWLLLSFVTNGTIAIVKVDGQFLALLVLLLRRRR